MVFPQEMLRQAKQAMPTDVNLTDSGHHGLFLHTLSAVYHHFFGILDLQLLKPVATEHSQIRVTGFPQGLPSWEVEGGAEQLGNALFWAEYDRVLLGFLDFYRTFFALVSDRAASVPPGANFPDQVENILLFNNDFFNAAREVRLKVLQDPKFANEIRWQPAYKQLLYRDDRGRLIVTISQNSVGNAITELLGIVVRRIEDEEAYRQAEPALLAKLLEVRQRLILADLGTGIETPSWPAQ